MREGEEEEEKDNDEDGRGGKGVIFFMLKGRRGQLLVEVLCKWK